MIFTNSRYFTGPLSQMYVYRNNKDTPTISVSRAFPPGRTIKYSIYTWADGDSASQIADTYLGDASLWWKIMDANPEVHDAFHILPGTAIRIPNV
jgi:nucleoid-associated protein YgaU